MSSQDDAAPPAKRSKMVVFEPIRLPSIYNVRTLNEKVLPAQHAKLTERFRIKLRHIGTLEKRIEELENRHASDDELICIINRQWNQLDETMVDLLRRFQSEGNLNETVANTRSETNWLTILSQLNNDEIAQRLSSRVNFSTEALTHLLKAMNAYSQKRERILAFLEGSRKRNGSPEGAEDSRDAMENSQDVPDGKIDIDAALREELTGLATENKRLEAMIVKLRSEKSRLGTKVAAHEEQMELLETKAENAINQMEDLRFELEKSIAKEEKLEGIIVELKKRNEELLSAPEVANPSASQEKPAAVAVEKEAKSEMADINQKQLEDLQFDLEVQTELADKRLNEINSLTNTNQQLAEKAQELEMNNKYLSTGIISTSPDFICLRFKFTQLFEASKRLDAENQELVKHIEDLRQGYKDNLTAMKEEFNTAMQRMQQNCLQMTAELMSVKKECAQMELEFKQKCEVEAIETRNYNEVKLLIDAAQNDANRKTEEMDRMKKQIAGLKAEVTKAKEDLEQSRKIYDTCVVISLDEKPQPMDVDTPTRPPPASSALTPTGIPAPVPPPVPIDKKIKTESSSTPNSKRSDVKYRPSSRTAKQEGEEASDRSIKQSPNADENNPKFDNDLHELRAKVSALESFDQETRSKIELLAREKRLERENEAMREKIRKYHRQEKAGTIESARRKIHGLTQQTETLRKELNCAKQAEEGLMREMENTTMAVEKLMRQNRTLTDRIAEQETTHVRLVKDGLQSEAALRAMKQQNETLEEKMRLMDNELQATQIESTTLEEKSKLLELMISQLEQTNRKTNAAMESFRRNTMNINSDLSELKLRHEKQTAEVQDLRQQMKERAANAEGTRTKIVRLREERNVLRKKLARAKQATEFDNIDQLLETENRALRESLACPSCKTNDKNTVLTKCYHVFCMDCIKRRYDARSRKCPKCNTTFGANDYHRLFI